MEDEVDVDIEGDETESGMSELEAAGLVQEQFVQSAWASSAGILPWELDSSISPENREVIERMLLEEHSPSKTSAGSSGSSSRWSKQEKELFEKGLAQFGRRWTKIAKLVESRTVLQVKSYARQYFKHKICSSLCKTCAAPPQPTSSHTSTLTNAVRIEKLSDDEDEDVDITDDLSDQGDTGDKSQAELKSDLCEPEETPGSQAQTLSPSEEQGEAGPSEGEITQQTEDRRSRDSQSPPHHQHSSSFPCSKEPDETVSPLLETSETGAQTHSRQMKDEGQSCQPESSAQLEEACSDGTDSADKTEQILSQRSEEDLEEEEDNEDEEELKVPEQEIEMDKDTITEDEKQAIPEFFEGRTSKTPERYLKIRNYILDQWLKSKPKYLNKTSVRPGLKNCGDVNCIGRIHTYLELIGAINFSCEQAVYNRPKVVDRSKHKVGKDVLEAYQLAQRLQSMRTRKRRVRDIWGNWCDAKDLEGQTYEHLSAEELALRREEMKKQPRPCKMSRYRGSLDPFQLIPCRSFGEDVQHAHVSRGEVIGLLGGTFNEEEKVLKICAAEPCNSVSTGLQCEMDPVSQTQACDVLSSLGFSVVGWYHSHPSFHPNPSVRDITHRTSSR
ncbi:hypothetical protein INR49_008622 [Caranx melampygus]|nr:hypothetical protein INR49_008622 [Caranx melampygus]